MTVLHSAWRQDFPALTAFTEQGQTYLDSAATAQKPQAMLDALRNYYAGGAANVHRAQHLPGENATRAFEGVRKSAARWLNAESAEHVIFTSGATAALNLLAYSLEPQFNAGDEIAISAAEHHANLLPWQQLALRKNLKLTVLPLNRSGCVDLAHAKALIGPRTRLLAITQLSNVLGAWQPLPELIALAQHHGALTVIDGAQGAVHRTVDVQALGCDFYTCSAHKLYGPEGVGLLYGRSSALTQLRPWQFGGEMVHSALFVSAEFRRAPLGFEAGTPAIGAVIAFGATLNYLNTLDHNAVAAHEQTLQRELLTGLHGREGVQVIGQPNTALACFNVAGVHHADLAQLLCEQGIAVRSGQHCAQPLMQYLGLNGAIRVSLALYNNGDDLQRFFHALDSSLEILR